MCDFGKTRPNEIGHKHLEWFLEQVRSGIGKNNIQEILSVLRETIADFEKFEASNCLSLDMRLWTAVAGLFRHRVVHSKGRILHSYLIPALKKSTGHSFCSSKASPSKKLASIKRYLRKNDDHWELQLIDETRLKPPYHFVQKPLFDMVDILTNHACLAYAQALRHFGHVPFWQQGRKQENAKN
jgi:hypothetical protein